MVVEGINFFKSKAFKKINERWLLSEASESIFLNPKHLKKLMRDGFFQKHLNQFF